MNLKAIKVTSVDEYKKRIEELKTRGIFLWDTTRKPDFGSIVNNSVEINDEIYLVATFDTFPFEDIEEYRVWRDSLDLFIKLHQRIPLSLGDFLELKEYVEDIFTDADNQEHRDTLKQAFIAGKNDGEKIIKNII